MRSGLASSTVMPARVALAGLSHETNTYAAAAVRTTALADFVRLDGAAILDRYRGTRTYVGGMLAAAPDAGIRLVPTSHAYGEPSGTIEAATHQTLRAHCLAGIRAALPVDGVLLELHGAAVAEGTDDVEGDLLERVRALVGATVPVVVVCDLHGNLSDRMVAAADLILADHYYPHTDMWDRGAEAAGLSGRLVRGELQPAAAAAHLPMLLPVTTTDHGVAAEILRRCAQVEARAGVIDCTFFHGFPYADTPEVGAHVLCTTDGDAAAARAAATAVARWVWERREEFRRPVRSAEEVVAEALACRERPVVIADTSDNPGGGAPGDATTLLRALLAAGASEVAFATMRDADAARAAHAAGVGAELSVRLGGKHDRRTDASLPVRARVARLTDGRFRLRRFAAGLQMDLGPSALLIVAGVEVIVTSRPGQTFDDTVFALHGVDVTRRRIVAVKSSHHFRAGFRDVAGRILIADTPDGSGLTTQRVEAFPRARAGRPLWPAATAAHWEAGE